MKRLIQVMLGIYVILFVVALFSLTGCTKYHCKSSDSPKNHKVDVSIKTKLAPKDWEAQTMDLEEMNEFPEANLEDPMIKIYHVTFIT